MLGLETSYSKKKKNVSKLDVIRTFNFHIYNYYPDESIQA